MKLPVQNPKTNNYQSLEDIQARKDELLDQTLHTENTHFSAKWNQLFMAKEDHSKTAFIGGLLVNGITVLDFILTARKALQELRFYLRLREEEKEEIILILFL